MTRTCKEPGCEEVAVARGYCNRCYARWLRRRRRIERFGAMRLCRVCGSSFEPERGDHGHCSEGCQRFTESNRRRWHGAGEEVLPTRDQERFRAWLRIAKEAGLRRFHPRASARKISEPERGYFIPWRRSCGLFVIRVKWPTEQREEEAA